MEYYPSFFESIFNDIFPNALNCSSESSDCISQTREKIDSLSASVVDKNVLPDMDDYHLFGRRSQDFKPSNQQPMYFIMLLSNDDLAKLFFSGGLIIEPIDTKKEELVKEFLEGKRSGLYGLQLREEISLFGRGQILKTHYLEDLYSQAEVIVPYKVDNKIMGAVVYLHGE